VVTDVAASAGPATRVAATAARQVVAGKLRIWEGSCCRKKGRSFATRERPAARGGRRDGRACQRSEAHGAFNGRARRTLHEPHEKMCSRA
jgi:hypothetical protein